MEEEIKELQTLATKHLTQAEYPGLRVGPETRLGEIYAKILRLTESYPNGFTEGIIGEFTYLINQLDENLRAPFEEIRDGLTPLPPRKLSLKEKNFAIIQFIEDMTGMGWETMEEFNKVMWKIDRAFMGLTGSAVSKKQIGECGVDAGCLMIIDPCYIKYLPQNEDVLFDSVVRPLLFDEERRRWPPDGQVIGGPGGVKIAVVSGTGGDGLFPVYAYFNEENVITKLEIIFRK